MKYQAGTFRVKITKRLVSKEITTEEWNGRDSDELYGTTVHKETISVRRGTCIDLYPVDGFRTSIVGVGYWCNNLDELEADYKSMQRCSAIYGIKLPTEVVAECNFSTQAKHSIIVDEEYTEDEFTIQIQYGMKNDRFYFSDNSKVELIPHRRFEKYGFDKCELTELSEDDFSEYQDIINNYLKTL